MAAPLVLGVTRREVAAVIAHEDEDGVFGEVLFFEDFENPANRIINGFNATVVVRQLRLPDSRESPKVFGDIAIEEALRTQRLITI